MGMGYRENGSAAGGRGVVEVGMKVKRAQGVVFYGSVIAVVLALVAVGAGYVYLEKSGAFTRTDSLDRVVVVFASHAEDGAEVAQVVAVATDGGRVARLLDPQQEVTIPGTSSSKLLDAYPFGGGKAVADALGGGKTLNAYVDVPEEEWVALLKRAGDISIVLPKSIEVFDGTRLVSFGEGTRTVSGVDVPALLRGAAYLDTADRMKVVGAVGEASLRALAADATRTRVRTNLTAEAYARLIEALSAR
jgi:hypothetical protein